VQRDVPRLGRVRSDVLRPRPQDPPGPGVRTVQLHFPVVLRGQVQRVPVQEDSQHVPVDRNCIAVATAAAVARDQLTALI